VAVDEGMVLVLDSNFKGEKIDFYDFTETLECFKSKSIVVELISNSRVVTFQHYENFISDMITEDALIMQDEENEDKSPVTIYIDDIKKITEGTGANIDHYVIQLRNKQEVFIHIA
jgi:hypothetical protein